MKERPILFGSEMVRAILEGRKTQTRRVIKPQPISSIDGMIAMAVPEWYYPHEFVKFCPHGASGDRLWVRETWGYWPGTLSNEKMILYKELPLPIDNYYWPQRRGPVQDFVKWRPSIFMPRWASRINLEITGVRVERVQSIHRRDCQDEGILCSHCRGYTGRQGCTCQQDFVKLWDSINTKRGYPWDTNPWVWVIEFRRTA